MATDTPMQLGMVGLGRMGAGIVRRLTRDGHHCVGYDVNADAVKALESDGDRSARRRSRSSSPSSSKPRTRVGDGAGGRDHGNDDPQRWPSVLEAGDVIIDGGNTHYRDDIRHAAELREKGIHHVDVGTSGGVWGLERGFCLMIGGEQDVVEPAVSAVRLDRARRRQRRRARRVATGTPSPSEIGLSALRARTAPGTS